MRNDGFVLRNIVMEKKSHKNVIHGRDLGRDNTHNVSLVQLGRTLVENKYQLAVNKSGTGRRTIVNNTTADYNSKEINELQEEFNNINLNSPLRLKTLTTLLFKSRVNRTQVDNYNMVANSTNDILKDFKDDHELVINNDNEFKLMTKSPRRNYSFKETPKNKLGNSKKVALMDLNKDINENNEDIFRIACTHKSLKYEELNERKKFNTQKTLKVRSISPSSGDESESYKQNLLTVMTMVTKTQENNDNYDKTDINNVEINEYVSRNYRNVDHCNITTNESTDFNGVDDILCITPIRVPFVDKEKYLMEKFVRKWKNFIKYKKRYIEEQRQVTLDNFFKKIAKKKMDLKQETGHGEDKAKHLLRDFNTYEHRYKIQKHIIALQKVKLEEQNRIIEELKYNKIIEASRQSVDDMKEEVRRAYYELDRQLKPKIKCLTKDLKIADIEEPSLVLHCLKVPQFLQRMEKRAREREEKHAIIRERRRQMEEERIRLKQQAELVKAEMDKEDKMKRIKELKEKRRKERVETIRKKQWCERLRGLIVMADLHYEKTLKSKYGIAPLRKLLEIKRDQMEKAREYYMFQLKNNVFLHWMWYTEDMGFERNFKAEDFYRKKLLRKVFKGFKMMLHNVTLRKQVADDYYDLYLTQAAFRMFCEGFKVIKKENEMKWQKAVIYHSSNLLFKAFVCWRTLPALNALKRDQEARKARWREKVLQVVPDYSPPED